MEGRGGDQYPGGWGGRMSARDVQEAAVVLAVEHSAARVLNLSKRQPQLGK
jgi:hypothetical protein